MLRLLRTRLGVWDINGDGIDELLSSSGGKEFSLHEKRAGGYELTEIVEEFDQNGSIAGAHDITVGDIDGDGDLDVLTNNREALGVEFQGTVSWHEFQSGMFVKSHLVTRRGGQIKTTQLVDLDGDLDLDILTPIGGWFENLNGKGQFELRIMSDNRNPYEAVSVGDLDRDGDFDVLAMDRRNLGAVLLLENIDGMGTFAPPKTVDTVSYLRGGRFIDLDIDGDLDIVALAVDFSPPDSRVFWYENVSGEFQKQPNLLETPSVIKDLEFGDLDNDGDLDAIVALGDSVGSQTSVHWYENLFERVLGDVNSDGEFGSADLVEIFLAGEYEDGIPNNSTYDEGDFNGDGDFDSSDFVFALTHGDYKQSNVFSRADLSSALLPPRRLGGHYLRRIARIMVGNFFKD